MEEIIKDEVITNEVTNEVVDEFATTNPGKGFKVAAAIGVVVLAGVGICKLGKKIAAKIKARKANKSELVDDAEYVEVDESEMETVEAE